MEIVQLVAIGLVSAILALTIKKESPQISMAIAIAASALIFFQVMPRLAVALDLITGLAKRVDTNLAYLSVVMKVVGISYISEFGAQICADAGESAIASKIEIGGKVLIMAVSAPVMLSLVDLILNILP